MTNAVMKPIVSALIVALVLAGCGAETPAAQAPAPAVQTQVVTRVVTVVQRQTVVVVVTPTESTAKQTAAATLAPAAVATPTPEPAVTAKTTKAAGLFSSPDEGYKRVADLAAGEIVTVLYRGGAWFQVKNASGMEGWLYKDWIDLGAQAGERIPTYPKALPVIVGKIVQETIAGSTVFKGRVFNVGAQTAYRVRAEIETFDSKGERADLAAGPLDNPDLGPGETSNFTAITSFGYDSYTPSVRWDNDP